MTAFDDTVTALQSLDLQALRYEVETLRAIKAWAMDRLGVDYQPGDRVVIAAADPSDVASSPRSGWHHYREALAPGQSGIAGEITFNSHSNRWQVLIGLDRAWSVHTDGWGDAARTRRCWRGPVDETPEGYTPPSRYDQERHPGGRVKHFAMDVSWLAKAPS